MSKPHKEIRSTILKRYLSLWIRSSQPKEFFKKSLERVSNKHFFDVACYDLESSSKRIFGNREYTNIYDDITPSGQNIPIGKMYINGDISVNDCFNEEHLTDDEMFSKFKRNEVFNCVLFDKQNNLLTIKTLKKENDTFLVEEKNYNFNPETFFLKLTELHSRTYDNEFTILFDRNITFNSDFNSFDPMLDMNGEMTYNDQHYSYHRFEKHYNKGIEDYSYESSFNDGVESFRLIDFSNNGNKNVRNGTIRHDLISFNYEPHDTPFNTEVANISLCKIGGEVTPESLQKAIELSNDEQKLNSKNVTKFMKKKVQEKKSKTQFLK